MKRLGIGMVIAGSLLGVAALLGHHGGFSVAGPLAPGSVDFVVSSTADAGPGSLRDAILAADRLDGRAHIVISAKQITLESALPALLNPRGITIEAGGGAGIIDASRQSKGPTLQINSKASVIHGVHIQGSRELAILVAAAGVEFDSVTVTASKTGMEFSSAAKGCGVRQSIFDGNETGIIAEPGVDDLSVVSSVFRNNSRAGFWFVGSAAPETGPSSANAREHARILDGTFDKNGSAIVLANQDTMIQKSHFSASRESAILLLSGAARIEGNEIRSSGGTAISVTAGRHVVISHNSLLENRATAISARDSQATIDHNILVENGFGIVSILGDAANPVSILENQISRGSSDAITLIGGSAQVTRNQINDNHGAGLRVLDFVSPQGAIKATPHLEANILIRNGADMPQLGTYKVAGTVPR